MKQIMLINQLRGKVNIELEGAFPERFLNLCAQNDIQFWGARKSGETTLRLTVYPQGYGKIRQLAATAGCTVRRISAEGVPFTLFGMRKRVALFVGLAVFLVVALCMSQFIWEFEVEGNKTLSEGLILQNLSELGVKIGTPSNAVEIERIRNEMILRLDSLYWIAVNVKGSRATVIVRERVLPPDIVPADTPSNVVAKKPGLIVGLNAFYGSPQVQAGQTVEAGQLLVSGVMDSNVVGARFVHAEAQVTARTWRDTTAVAPLETTQKQYTQKEKTRNALIFAGWRVNLYSDGSAPFDNCDKMISYASLKLPGGVILPIALVTETYREYVPTPGIADPAETEQRLRTALEKGLWDSIERGEVVQMTMAAAQYDGLLAVRLTAECLEEIGQIVELPLSD